MGDNSERELTAILSVLVLEAAEAHPQTARALDWLSKYSAAQLDGVEVSSKDEPALPSVGRSGNPISVPIKDWLAARANPTNWFWPSSPVLDAVKRALQPRVTMDPEELVVGQPGVMRIRGRSGRDIDVTVIFPASYDPQGKQRFFALVLSRGRQSIQVEADAQTVQLVAERELARISEDD